VHDMFEIRVHYPLHVRPAPDLREEVHAAFWADQKALEAQPLQFRRAVQLLAQRVAQEEAKHPLASEPRPWTALQARLQGKEYDVPTAIPAVDEYIMQRARTKQLERVDPVLRTLGGVVRETQPTCQEADVSGAKRLRTQLP
jgi:hypothetical protein